MHIKNDNLSYTIILLKNIIVTKSFFTLIINWLI